MRFKQPTSMMMMSRDILMHVVHWKSLSIYYSNLQV